MATADAASPLAPPISAAALLTFAGEAIGLGGAALARLGGLIWPGRGTTGAPGPAAPGAAPPGGPPDDRGGFWRALLARLRGKPAAKPVPKEAVGFQGELEDLLAEGPPAFLGGAHYLVALLFVLLLAISAVAEVDIVVTGQGRLVPDSPPIVLQPMERAVIRELRVRPGDTVRAGQVLAVLDTTFADADTATLGAQRRALTAQSARIEAELAGRPPQLGSDIGPDALLQAVLQSQRQALRDTRLRAFDEDLSSLAAGIHTLEQSAGSRAQQAGLARDVETMRARLAESQVGSRLSLLNARSARVQAEQELAQTRNRIEELRHTRRSREAERQSFLDDWRRALVEESVRLRGEMARVEEQLGKANRMTELTQLTAPQDGVVLEVARRSVGSVVREAEPLVVLVPLNMPLIAEIALRSADLGHARTGDPVVLKVDAFPFQRHGTLHGRLRAIAPESGNRGEGGEARPAQGMATHAGQVEVTSRDLVGLPEGVQVIPGMTLTAEIKVGTRRVLSYFLTPLTRGLQEAIREP